MFFPSRIVVLIFFMLINLTECITNYQTKCTYSNKALDQELVVNKKVLRPKRFVLFPEFISWLNDWRYLNHPKHFLYYISNYYPKQIDSNHIRSYIHHIINDINQFIHSKISSIHQASSPDQANFHYHFFNYEICPTDDPLATTQGVQNKESLLIYPRKIVQENRYRAHGGIALNHLDNSTTSNMKFNIHHTFLLYQDFQYDPVIYTCKSNENDCIMDLYSTMLHETLHGFGIEHTESILPNKKMRAVMHLYASRIMCHDDIRAIRKVYGLSVKRENSKFDDTCRRDFPLNTIQKIMYYINRWIIRYCFFIGPFISFTGFVFTVVYIILRKRCLNKKNSDDSSSIASHDSSQQYHKQHKTAKNAFLWHGDYL